MCDYGMLVYSCMTSKNFTAMQSLYQIEKDKGTKFFF